MSSELSTGKTIIILAVVIGCFAVLWPKVFHPMLTSSGKPSTVQATTFRDPANAHFLSQLCFLVREHNAAHHPLRTIGSDEDCMQQISTACKQTLTENALQNYRLLKDKTTLTRCLTQEFNLSPEKVMAAVPPSVKSKPYTPNVPHPHTRPERPTHLHPEGVHPALKEKGRMLPQRTIEKQARPGPMPGMRPPLGGGGHMVPPQSKGTGTMGLIMPIYTVGIVIFFVYTIMKVLFKKGSDDDKTAKLKSFNLDPEYRKYIFAEEYLDSSNTSHRDMIRRHERETSKHRRRHEAYPDPKIEDEQMDQLRRRLEETESAMERLMSQMGSVTDKLTAAKITEVLTQAQTQAKILKDWDENTEDFTNSFTEEFSLPLVLQKRLEELHLQDMCEKGTLVDDQPTDDIEFKHLNMPHADTKVHEKEKQPEEVQDENIAEGISDMAQAGSDSNDGDHRSDASETGADISDLNTFADGAPSPIPCSDPMPVIEDDTPEVNFMTGSGIVSDARRKLLNEDVMYGPAMTALTGKEQATQTEAAKKLSVLDLQTTYQLKEQAKESDNSSNRINEFLLDATVPVDTQLLVQEAQIGSQPADDIEMDSTDNENRPCVVTSQVSLAFVGLEQSGRSDSPMMIIIPEQRGRASPSSPIADECPDIQISVPEKTSNKEEEEPIIPRGTEQAEDVNNHQPMKEESLTTERKDVKEATDLDTVCSKKELFQNNETTLYSDETGTNKLNQKIKQEIRDPSNIGEIDFKVEASSTSPDETLPEGFQKEREKDIVKEAEKTSQSVAAPQSKTSVTKINLEDYGSEEDASDDDSNVPQKIMRSKTNPNEVLQIIERPGQPRTYRKIIYVDESDPEEEIQAVENMSSNENVNRSRPISPRLELISQPLRPDSPVPPFSPSSDQQSSFNCAGNISPQRKEGKNLDQEKFGKNSKQGKEEVPLPKQSSSPQQTQDTPPDEDGADLTKISSSQDEIIAKGMESAMSDSHDAENS